MSNIVIKHFDIEKIIKTSRDIYNIIRPIDNIYEDRKPSELCGACCLGRSVLYWSAKLYGVPPECVRLLNSAYFVKGASHGFVLLILDKIYLCDLTFSQFVKSDDELGNLIRLYKKGYTEISESVIINFLCYTSRPINLEPIKSSGNFLEQVISHSSDIVEHSSSELKLYKLPPLEN